jgi:hypothetical protein
VAISEVVVSIWVLDVALVVISAVVATGFVAITGCDVAVERQGSGLENRGWGVCRGPID